MHLLWFLLPDELLPLVIIGVGLALIVGLLRPRAVFAILSSVVLLVVAAPLVGELFDALPSWVALVVLVFIVLGVIRSVFALLIGSGATDHMVGYLAATSLLFLLSLPFRFVAALIRAFRIEPVGRH